MLALDLSYPSFIDYALPGDRQCGICPSGGPEELAEYCPRVQGTHQG